MYEPIHAPILSQTLGPIPQASFGITYTNRPINSSEKTVKLDQEAKQIYEELSGDALLKRIDEVKTGWFTSYVALFNEHTMNNNIIQINECDVLKFLLILFSCCLPLFF